MCGLLDHPCSDFFIANHWCRYDLVCTFRLQYWQLQGKTHLKMVYDKLFNWLWKICLVAFGKCWYVHIKIFHTYLPQPIILNVTQDNINNSLFLKASSKSKHIFKFIHKYVNYIKSRHVGAYLLMMTYICLMSY